MSDPVLTVSPSEIARFLRCRRSWMLAYHLQWAVDPVYAPVTSVALLGTRVHTAMEAYYGHGIEPVAALSVIYDLERERCPDRAGELDAEQDEAVVMVAGYMEWAAGEGIDEMYEVVGVERTLEVPLKLYSGSVAVVSGKLDLIVRRRFDGALLTWDFKTVGSLSKADLLVLDPQMRIYTALLTLVSGQERVDGALYTMLRRSKQTARAKGPFYEQVHISYNQVEHVNMLTRLRGVLGEMERVKLELGRGVDHRLVAYPTPMTDRCGWDCSFTHVCALHDDGSRVEAALAAQYVRRDPYAYRSSGLIDDVKAAFGV